MPGQPRRSSSHRLRNAIRVKAAAPRRERSSRPASVAPAAASCAPCGKRRSDRSLRNRPARDAAARDTSLSQPCEDVQRPRPSAKSRRKLTVNVPAGVDDGSRFALPATARPECAADPPGDLYVYLTVVPHPLFRRDGLETFVDIPISFPQAAMGATFEVPSLERRGGHRRACAARKPARRFGCAVWGCPEHAADGTATITLPCTSSCRRR